MQVAVRLESAMARRRLVSAVGTDYEFAFVSSWVELDELIRRRSVEIVVVDPACSDVGADVAPIERLRAYYPSLSVVLYMPFSSDLVDSLLRLGSIGLHSAVFFDQGDTPQALDRAMREAVAASVSERILARIFESLEVAPRRIVTAFRAALREIDEVRTALEWSRVVGVPHRSFYRLFRTHSFPTPKTCLQWLRLMYAVRILEDPGYSPYDVVRRLGFSAPSNFWQHVHDLLGLRASELRYAVDFDALLERFLSEHVRRSGEGRGYSAG